MPKVIESPVKRFAGHVVLPDYLTFPQYRLFNECWQTAKRAKGESKDQRQAMLPGVLACVNEWHLENIFPDQLTPETFPATPMIATSKLLSWLIIAITQMIYEADESPNV